MGLGFKHLVSAIGGSTRPLFSANGAFHNFTCR